jgi:hypothetical protein
MTKDIPLVSDTNALKDLSFLCYDDQRCHIFRAPTGMFAGSTGATGRGVVSIINITPSMAQVTYTDATTSTLDLPTGPEGQSIVGPTGPSYPAGSTTGVYTQYFAQPGPDSSDLWNQVSLLRQPTNYQPAQFGAGLCETLQRTPNPSAVVIGDHNNSTFTKDNALSVAIGTDAGSEAGVFSCSVGQRSGIDSEFGSVNLGTASGQLAGTGCVSIGFLSGGCSDATHKPIARVAIGSFIENVLAGAGTDARDYSVSIGSGSGRYAGTGAISVSVHDRYTQQTNTGENSVTIGRNCGSQKVQTGAIAVGDQAARDGLGADAVSIGTCCGVYGLMADRAVGIGKEAARDGIGANAVAVGYAAGITADTDSVSLGPQSGYNAGQGSVCIGNQAGRNTTNPAVKPKGCVAIGSDIGGVSKAAGTDAKDFSVAIGPGCGVRASTGSVSVGWHERNWGQVDLGENAVTIGRNCGNFGVNANAVCIGSYAAEGGIGGEAVVIGTRAGNAGGIQHRSVAVGPDAGSNALGPDAVAVGWLSGNSADTNSVSVGSRAGTNTGEGSVCIGHACGENTTNPTVKPKGCVAIGGHLSNVSWGAGKDAKDFSVTMTNGRCLQTRGFS